MAKAGRDGEVRYPGTFNNAPETVARLVRKLSSRYEKLYFCYEVGSTDTGCIGRSCRTMDHKRPFLLHGSTCAMRVLFVPRVMVQNP